jgi:superfamily II DNA or RNA helicase
MNLPRHPKAKHFHGLGLMSGVQSFAEIEARIAALPTEQARGAALEVFAEACLATQRIYQAREVWPGNSMPLALRQQLRLPMADMGVDGVFVSSAEEPVCYQSKFRTGRPALTWTELSTFYGLADVGGRRLVFTNCDEVARVAEERLGAIFVRGGDLDRLTPEDFEIIEAWLAERPITPKRHDPKPHQGVALNDIVGALSHGSRATALMACGSGKTLVALWAAERLGARTVLILLPSLALVRQTLHEWLHQTSWPDVQFLCVCSDPTVQPEEDSLLVRPSDLDFAVTTQPADVRRFLERSTDSVRLVFSTYQSSQVVAAGVAGLPPFDFGVFDEAHKTAGRDGAKFALALKDENLPIARRLFMTATPRHYDVAKKDKFGESKVVFSMDVPETYGQVVHRLPFSAAAKAGIITEYKVIISFVTSEMVTNEALRLGVVLVEGDEVKAQQVANQIALKSAIAKYNVSKVFTFHSKVKSAKSFTSGGPEGIGTHLEGFHCAHIEGAMTTTYREQLLREFAAAPRAILSNARCLTEGVDVPAVDMVAFLSPKRSLVDIVQATGRAMRLSPETGKQFGYVLVPLYVEKARGETIEEAVLRSNFDEVWQVLQGLKEQDDLLAQIIAEMRIDRGRTGGFDDSRFRERVEMLGPELSLEMLRTTITAACLDAIGEQWFERYGQLLAYKQKHGDCDMPARWKENQKLATWVVDQRVRKRENNLEPKKVELLNRMGFNWNPHASNWRTSYLALLEYRNQFGDCRVPQEWKGNQKLAKWVGTQRVQYARGKLSRERIALLDKVGFDWDLGKATWDERFSELCAFKERFQHTRVKTKWAENPLLGAWVVEQRYNRRKGKLRDDYFHRLNSIGFEWDGRVAAKLKINGRADPEQHWREIFEQLKAYAATNGVGMVKVVDEETKRLNRWVLKQRQAKKRGRLCPARVSALDEIGFVWQAKSRSAISSSSNRVRSWDEMYSALVEFFKLHGHCNVPENGSIEPDLFRWMLIQKQSRWNKRLPAEQIRKLDVIGFPWSAHDATWDEMFTRLAEFTRPMHNGRKRNVPPSDDLRSWMWIQRQKRRKGELADSRIKRLSSIGFDWDPYEDRWSDMMNRLQNYREAHGNCQVPDGWLTDPKLARWVRTQRAQRSQGKLSSERIKMLDQMGFEWATAEGVSSNETRVWEQMFKRLLQYRDSHGDTLVPQRWKEDRSLADWVSKQRSNYNRGRLSLDRVQQLEKIDFNWDPIGTHWEEMFQQLVDFKNEHGHTNVPQGSVEYAALATWVRSQRAAKRYNRPIIAERGKRLEEIGFSWRLVEQDAWDSMFERLVQFEKEHGHCNVPQRWPADKKLGRWVNTMRHRTGRLKEHQVKRLESIGFVWNTKLHKL